MPLLAVLESKSASSRGQADTVAIAGLDGFAKAKTTFAPAVPPVIHISQGGQTLDFPVLLPPRAYVAGGLVYFLDGSGRIRSLSPTNAVQDVLALPQTMPNQLASFAVSPDGAKILASVVSFPTVAITTTTFTVEYDVYAGSAGRLTLLRHGADDAASSYGQVPELIGWDATTAREVYPATFFAQGGAAGRWHGDAGALLATGQAGAPFNAPDCMWVDGAPDGSRLCLAGSAITVKLPSGGTAWTFQDPPHAYSDGTLAPDGRRAAVRRQQGPTLPERLPQGSYVTAASGQTALPGSFLPVGWATSSLLIGATSPSTPGLWPSFAPLSYVDMAQPDLAHDLGFSGDFVGGLTAP